MSSDFLDENSRCRKPKVSEAMLISFGLVGSKEVPFGISDVQSVNIRIPFYKRFT